MTLIFFILAGLAGMVAHWFKKWATGEFDCNLYEYIMVHKRHTAGAVLTTVGSIIGLVATGNVEISQQTLALAFFAGYTFDSSMNKGA
jgi:hypothetical protein